MKVLPEGRADKPSAVARFLREAKSATKIDHDNIVDVVSFDTTEERRLHRDGAAQRQNLADGSTGVRCPSTAPCTSRCRCVGAARGTRVRHRAPRPQAREHLHRRGNTTRDFVKVLDFGISKVKSAGPRRPEADRDGANRRHAALHFAGARPGESVVDHRTDVYALGVILYEMLTGSPPFTGQNHFQLLYKHGNEAPDPPSQRSKKASIPPHVETAVLRAHGERPGRPLRQRWTRFAMRCEGRRCRERARTLGLPLLGAALVAGVAFLLWPTAARRWSLPSRWCRCLRRPL